MIFTSSNYSVHYIESIKQSNKLGLLTRPFHYLSDFVILVIWIEPITSIIETFVREKASVIVVVVYPLVC